MYHSIIKAIDDKPTANIILNSERLKSFKVRNKTRMPTLIIPIEHSTGNPSQRN